MADPNALAPEAAPDTPPSPEASAVTGDDLQARLAAAEAEAARLGDEFLRAKAEAENTRRRAADDVAKAHKYAVESFAASLLAVRDSLEAALAVGAPTVESFREGVEVTHRQLTAALEKAGVTEVDPAGQKFDPHRHEAMGQADGGEPNTVATVLRKGYLLNDRVIRPALVMVSRGPAAPGPEGAPGA